MQQPVNIQVSAPDKAKKGYLMAIIARTLRQHGVDVLVQGETPHLAEKDGIEHTCFG